MIKDAEDCKAALNDTINDHPELEHLRLSREHQQKLTDIKRILIPFKEYIEQVSKKAPSIQLYNMLTSIIKKEGEYTYFNNNQQAL